MHKEQRGVSIMISILWKTALLSVVIGVESSNPHVKIDKEPLLNTGPLFQQDYASKPLRILAVLPVQSYSHHIMSETLMMELARRGHHVTMVSPYPPKEPVPNYNHVDVSDVQLSLPEILFSFESLVEEYESKDVDYTLEGISQIDGHETCRKIFNHTRVKPLLQSKIQFDVFFSEVFGSGCTFAIGTKLQIPSIAIVTSPGIDWVGEYSGETFNPSYIESVFLTPTAHGLSSLVERLKNTFYYIRTRMAVYKLFTRPSEIVVHELLGTESPSLQEIRKNISLFMSNFHPSVFTAKPLVPRILPVGGLHLRPPKPDKVPVEVKTWLDTAPNGVVYFSLGSLLPSASLPDHLFKAFADAFKELKHLRFLWKFESVPEPAKAAAIPDNVLIIKWAPQLEVLSHPNTKAFITHGGLMGTTESVYNGVPMVGIPVFAEQHLNMYRYEKLGISVTLQHGTTTKEKVVQAITKVTSDQSFRQRAKEVSRVFKDRPMSPLDSAVWWTEYIVRNNGAPHLESPVASMPFWKWALLDILAVVMAGISLLFLIVYFVIKRCLLRSTKPLPIKSRKKKEN